MDSYGLRAVRIIGHVWLVVRLLEGHELDLAASTQMLSASRFLLERVLDEMESSPNAAHGPEMVTLPDWGAQKGATRSAGAERLRGAYLILVDRDAEDCIGFRAIDMFSRLGVCGITYLSKFRNDTAIEVRFNPMSRWRRFAALAVLFARRKAAVANRRLAGPLKPVPFHPGEDGRCETPSIGALDASLDDTGEPEQYERFMLFEGGRQLVPVRNIHDRIASERDGRYSLWNRKLTFAPTDPSRLFRSLYWLVENDAANRALLPYYPVRDRVRGAAGSANLAAMLDAHAAPTDRPLRKGDTVVVATHALPPGGAERQWAYLAVGLKRAGYDVKVVVYRKLVGVDAHFAHLLEDEGIPVLDPDSVLLKPFSLFDIDDLLLWAIFKADVVEDLPKLWRFVEMMKRLDPKAVYVQLDEPNIYLSLAALVADVPHVVPSFRNTNPSTFAYHQPWFKNAYQVVARSKRVRMSGNSRLANDDYAGWLGLDPSRIACIPNALDEELFPRPAPAETKVLRSELGLHTGDQVVLGVFRLAEEKNPLCFLRTVERVACEIPSVRAFVVGVGRLADAFAREIEARGLSGVVTVLGQRSDVNVLMSLSDLLLLTSSHEGLPNVVLEAQLSGLPVVATDVGGTSEALNVGESGMLCRSDDDAALAAACIEILTNEDRGRRMAEAGLNYVRERFGLHAMVERYLELAGVVSAPTQLGTGAALTDAG